MLLRFQAIRVFRSVTVLTLLTRMVSGAPPGFRFSVLPGSSRTVLVFVTPTRSRSSRSRVLDAGTTTSMGAGISHLSGTRKVNHDGGNISSLWQHSRGKGK